MSEKKRLIGTIYTLNQFQCFIGPSVEKLRPPHYFSVLSVFLPFVWLSVFTLVFIYLSIYKCNRWKKEFKGVVKLPSRDTVFDYFLAIEGGQCKFEPWTKHKVFQVVDFDSNTMRMNEVMLPIRDDLDMALTRGC